MRLTAPIISICIVSLFALALMGCGCGSSTEAATASAPQATQASFGSPTAAATLTDDDDETWDIRIFNFSSAQILDAGLRELGSNDPWIGGLSGHDPATFGAGINGGSYWLTVPRGAYEVFVETDRGTFTVSGFTPTATLDDGRVVPAPAQVSVWEDDVLGAPIPTVP